MLTTKICGAGLILLAGPLAAGCFLKPYRDHIKLLEEGNFLFCLMDSEIRHRKILLPDLFLQMAEKTGASWKYFFLEMNKNLTDFSDVSLMEIFRDTLGKYPGKDLSSEEKEIFIRFGEALISRDPELMKKNVSQMSQELLAYTGQLKKELNEKAKAVRIFFVSISLFLVILLA